MLLVNEHSATSKGILAPLLVAVDKPAPRHAASVIAGFSVTPQNLISLSSPPEITLVPHEHVSVEQVVIGLPPPGERVVVQQALAQAPVLVPFGHLSGVQEPHELNCGTILFALALLTTIARCW